MVDWESHKQEIIKFAKEGKSSKDIAKTLSKIYPEITRDKDRSVRNAIQRWRENNEFEIKQEPAKVLLFDIETAPMITYAWNRKPSYINDNHIIEGYYVINWAAKWLFDEEMMSGVVTPEESKNRDDERIVRKLWELLNEADIVIAHYGDKFDVKMMNGRFLKHGMNPTMPYKTIDTKKAASHAMRLEANNLDYIAKELGLGQKHDTNFQLWKDCMAGDEEALERMDEYCQQDVRILEDVYIKLRPFVRSHPNLGLFINKGYKTCPACGSTDLKKEGRYQTTVNIYDAYRCQDCGSITRNRKHALSKEHKQNITSSTPR